MFSKEKINDYADKLLIGLSENETDTLLREFDIIDKNMQKINLIDGLDNATPLSFPYEITVDSLRDDNEERHILVEDALKNCDNFIDREVEIPRVVK